MNLHDILPEQPPRPKVSIWDEWIDDRATLDLLIEEVKAVRVKYRTAYGKDFDTFLVHPYAFAPKTFR